MSSRYLDEEKVFIEIDIGKGPKIHIDSKKALSLLLADEVLFANGRQYLDEDGKTSNPETIVLFVNCNDVFAWACSDTENLPFDEIGNLYKMWKADPVWGSTKWCILHRNQKPQKPIEDAMRKAGSWTPDLDAIPENTMDEETQELFALAAQRQRDRDAKADNKEELQKD